MRSKFLFLAAALAAILLLPSITSGQTDYGVWINGTNRGAPYTNSATVNTAVLNGSSSSSSGYADLNNYGKIATVTANLYGRLYNREGGTVTMATFNNYTALVNYEDAIITTAMFYGSNSSYYNYGIITNATQNAGTLYNGRTPSDSYMITNLTKNGGTTHNRGRIDEMTYVGGTYNGTWGDTAGTIGTLNLAADSALNTGNWGTIEKLVFDNGGNGLITFTAISTGEEFTFSGGIKAPKVDFAYGNISLNLSALGNFGDDWASTFFDAFGFDDGFYLSSLFDATVFGGVEYLNSFGVTWGDDSFWILNNGVFGAGWSIDSSGFVSYAEVPEPATLLILGLGLAGLPIVRRLRKR